FEIPCDARRGALVYELLDFGRKRRLIGGLAGLVEAEPQHPVERHQGVPDAAVTAPIRLRDEFERGGQRPRSVQIVAQRRDEPVAIFEGKGAVVDAGAGLRRDIPCELAQVVEVGLSGAQPLLGECKLRAILGAEAEDPEGERIELRGGKVGEQGKLARALAYLVAALSNQEGVMDEAADEGTAGRALGLRDLVLVMDRNMIH